MPIESSQKKLDRVRSPRVHIVYETEVGNAIETREVPFVIGVLGDFSGAADSRPTWKDRKVFPINWEDFNTVLGLVQRRVRFKIASSSFGADLDIDLTFRHINDFEPEQIVSLIEPLSKLKGSGAVDDQEIIRLHLDQILHAPEFQQLESVWRGLWYLVSRTETSPQLQIKLIDVKKKELLLGLQRAVEFDRSSLFKKVYEEPYGSQDGDPFGLFIGAYTFTSSPEDLELLSKTALVAASCLAPFIAAAGPQMLGIESFAGLALIRDLPPVTSSTQYSEWMSFRESADARYVALTVPRMLLRPPYGIRPAIQGQYQYVENSNGDKYLLWGNSAFALGACIANAFARYGWCGSIRGIEGGGLVEGLPTLARESETGERFRSGIEVTINDRREYELAVLGL